MNVSVGSYAHDQTSTYFGWPLDTGAVNNTHHKDSCLYKDQKGRC